MAEPIKKYDSNENTIYKKNSFGYEQWYNENGNLIHFKSPTGYKYWCEYDKHNYNIVYLNTKDEIIWRKYPIFAENENEIRFY
jgi:hypothetical protein